MNSNIKNNNTPSSSLRPCQEGEIEINAQLLYLYVGHPEVSYEKWAESLHQMVSSSGHVANFELLAGSDGELALNDHFAYHFAQRSASNLIGAIALILIQEGRSLAKKNDSKYTNRWLKNCHILALADGWMHSNYLHAFLRIEESHEEWHGRLMETHAMQYGSDYARLLIRSGKPVTQHVTDTGEGSVMLSPSLAAKVAAAEPTKRGKMVQKCFSEIQIAK